MDLWRSVDVFFSDNLAVEDDVLRGVLEESSAAGLPAWNVSRTQGKFIHIIARMINAKRILEIGTLAGYSTIWLARALPESGLMITIEQSEKHAQLANRSITRAGLNKVVQIRVGKASAILSQLIGERCKPFDLIFIDADKQSNPEYLGLSLKLSHKGTVIIGDNVVQGGEVANASSTDSAALGAREFITTMGSDRSLSATALQTVGEKGYDGFSIALVG